MRFIIYNLFSFFIKTCISTLNQLLFRGLQHERIKVSAKWINVNVNVNERIPLYMQNIETLDTMGHHCAAASITTKKEPQGWSR